MSLGEQSIHDYLDKLSAKVSTPGGGAAAALTGAQAAALISMVAEFSGKTMANAERDLVLQAATSAKNEFIQLADLDATKFAELMKCYKSGNGVQEALKGAADAPLACITLATGLLEPLENIYKSGNANLVTDSGIAASLLLSTINGSILNVLINLQSIEDTAFVSATKSGLDQYESAKARLETIANKITSDLR